jgi:hypothetical protein
MGMTGRDAGPTDGLGLADGLPVGERTLIGLARVSTDARTPSRNMTP